MDVGRCRHKYEGFYEKIYIPNVYKSGENDVNSRCPCKPCENFFFFSSLSLLVKSFEEEI